MKNKKVCAFTGHRPSKFDFGYDEKNEKCQELKNNLIKQITHLIRNGTTTFLSGMAMCTDLWCTEIVIDFKKQFSKIELVAVLPCRQCRCINCCL